MTLRLRSSAYDLYRWRLWSRVRHGPMPQHLAVILDGNRRFVEERHLASLRDGYAAWRRRVRAVPRASPPGGGLRRIGRRDLLPAALRETLPRGDAQTAENSLLPVHFALG